MTYKSTLLIGVLLLSMMSSWGIDTPPSMYGNNTSPKYYTETNTPVKVFPNFTISDAENNNINGLTIVFTSGYQEGQDILSFTTQNGITGSFNATSGKLTLSGSASPANYQTAVRSITYSNSAATGSASYDQRTLTISLANGDYFSQDGGLANGHFYQVVVTAKGFNTSSSEASAKTYYGLKGYLATITSSGENTFIKNIIPSSGIGSVWIGGSDATSEGSWLWTGGPEYQTKFYNKPTSESILYTNWYSGEPNNDNGGEDYLLMYKQGRTAGTWGDGTNTTGLSYIVEYGGTTGDPTLTMTTTTTLNVVAPQPPVINGNNDSPTYNTSEYNPVLVFPNFTVTDTEGSDIKGLTIHFSTGYQNNQDTLLFTNTSKITGYFDDAKGALVLSGNASPAEYQAAMRSITYVNNAPLFSLIDGTQRQFTISLANADYFSQDGSLDNGHFYEYVNISATWTQAEAAASAKTYYGLQGYLPTITSAEENEFIKDKIPSNITWSWIGGSDNEVEATWKWITGPENNTTFYNQTTKESFGYTNWYTANGEPNNKNNEDYLAININGAWGDGDQTNGFGYNVEYGGMPGDPTINLTTTTTLNIDVVRPEAPGGIVDNLELWLNAGKGFTYTSSIDAKWMDQSRNKLALNVNLIQSPNSRTVAPTLANNSDNFNSTIAFDGVGTGLASAINAADFNFSEMSVFSVQKVASGEYSHTIWHYDNNGSNDLALFIDGGTTNKFNVTVNNAALGNVTTPVLNDDISHLVGFTSNAAASEIYVDAVNVLNAGGQSQLAANGALMIGLDADGAEAQDGDNHLKGNIGEVIMFRKKLSDLDRQKVESYLALKYGISLTSNYIASDETTSIWTDDSDGYNKDVFGIGQDDASGLDQKVSRSVNSSNSPILATTADFTSSNFDGSRTGLGDGNFITMAHDNGTENSFTSSFNGGTNNRSDRVWKVDETGTVGDVFFAIPKTAITFPSGIPVLVISSDETFNSSDNVINLTDDGTYYWASINPDDGSYVSFAATTPGFTLSKSALTIAENAGTGTFTVVLDAQPSNNVILNVTSDDTNEATIDKATLTFTADNWDTPQTITITGVDDNIDRGDNATITVSVNDASSDDYFDALEDQTVAVTLTNNDTAGFTVSESALTIDENSGVGSFTVVLNAEPTSDVVFDVSSNDTNEATVDKSKLTFTSADWDVEQTVFVTGVDDAIDREDFATITVAVDDASSDDTFDGLGSKAVAITLTNDDQTITFNTLAVKTYGNADFDLTGTASSNLDVIYTSSNTNVAAVSGNKVTIVGAGTTTITANQAGNENFNVAPQVSQTLTVNPKSITVTADADQAKVYGGSDPTYTYTVAPALESGDSFSGELTRATGENVGSYAIGQGTLSAGSNYNLTYEGANFTITPKGITVTADANQAKVYGGSDPTYTYTVAPALESGDSFSGELTRATGENVGSYAIGQGTLSAGSNYNLTYEGANFTITPKGITVTADANQAKVYGGSDPTYTYTVAPALESGDSFSGALTRATGENVGSYAIGQGTLTAGSNYNLTYEGANFTITPKGITVTADANQAKVYGGSDPTYTYTVAPALESGDSFSGALTRATGENVGSYAIGQGTLTAGSNYNLTYEGANFTITPKGITVTADANQAKVYGGSDPTYTYTVAPALESGDSFSGELTRATGENVGSYAIGQGTLSAGSNYNLSYEGANFTITPKGITVTADANQAKVYGGSDPTYTYTVAPALESGDSFSGELTRATGENVGSYAIGQGTLSAGSNYNLTYEGANFTITPKGITVTADANQAKVYGGSDPTYTYTVAPALESGDSFSGALTRATGENVGSYAIGQGTLTAGSNYNLSYEGANFTITPKGITVTADANQAKVYGGSDPTYTYTVAPALESGDSFSGELTRATGEDVGSYAIGQGTLTAGSNYNLSYEGANFTITPKGITVTADANQAKVYGGSDPTYTYTVAPALESGDSFSGELTRATGENVGSYAIGQGTLTAGSNYNLSYEGANFTITPKGITVTADANQAKVYGGSDPTYTYTVAPALESGDSFSGELTRATGEDVGSYAIGQGTLTAGSNYNLSYEGANFTITPKGITVTADANQAKVYGGSDPTYTYTVAPALESGDSFSGELTRATGENVGSYAIGQGTLTAGSNYNLTYEGANFTITPKGITVTADANQAKVYGGSDPTYTYTVAPALESGDSFSGALTRATGENVGSYAIGQGTLSAGSNYNLTYEGANFTITPKGITVTADANQAKVYGGSDPTYTYTVAPALESGDSFSGALTRATGENVGSYAIGQGTLTAGSNYNLTYEGANFTITPKGITVTADANQAKVYGGSDPTYTYTVAPALESGDSFSGELTRATGENVGSYAIGQGTLSAGSNYNLSYEGANFTITPKGITVTADANQAKVYGGSDPTYTYTVAPALESGDSFSGELTRATGEDVGSYAIGQGTLSAGSNYNLSYEGANFTITPKGITVTADANQAKVYGGSDPTYTYTVAPALESGDSFSGELTRATGEDVGSYAIGQGTLTAGSNYNLSYEGANFTITPKGITVTADANQAKVYGGSDPTYTYTVAPALESGDSFSGALTRATGENVGSYAIGQGTLTAGSNYNLTYEGANFTITPKGITVTADANQAKVYGGSDPTYTYTVAPALESGDSFSGALTRATGENVGSYAIGQGTLTAGSNYNLTYEGANFTITPKGITVTADANQAKVYGGSDPTYTYTVAPALESGDSFSGELTRATGENVGSYAIGQGTLTAGSNYNLTYEGANFTITPKGITVTADANQAKVYGGSDPTYTYTVAPALESGDSFSGALSRATGEDVGTYALTIGTLSAGSNYDLSFVSKDFAITQKVLTITADNQTKEYDGVVFSPFTVSYSGFENGDNAASLDGALVFGGNATTAINAGTNYIIIPGGLTSTNYDITFVNGKLDITQKALTITVDDKSKEYDGTVFSPFTVSYGGFVSGENETNLGGMLSFSGSATTATNVGTGYVITPGGLTSTNYAITFANGYLDITSAAQTITFDPLDPKVYNDAPFNLTGTSSSGLPVSYTSSNPAVAIVSGNTVTIVGAGSTNIRASQAGNSNYDAAEDIVQELIIDKASQVLTLNSLPVGSLPLKDFTDPIQVTASSSSGLPVVISLGAGSAATLNGSNQLESIGATGNVIINVDQVGDDNYNSATIQYTFDVVKSNQSITFPELTSQIYSPGLTLDLNGSATASSSLDVTYSVADGSGTITGTTLAVTGAGNILVTASQGGNEVWNPATDATQTLAINKATPVISNFENVTKEYSDAFFTLHATSVSTGLFAYSSSNTDVATITGNKVTIVGTGTTELTAYQDFDDNYTSATATAILSVGLTDQVITFAELEIKVIGDPDFTLSATGGGSGNPVVFTSSDETVAMCTGTNGQTVKIIGVGTCDIYANQAGNANYNTADQVNRSLTVNKYIAGDTDRDGIITPRKLSETPMEMEQLLLPK